MSAESRRTPFLGLEFDPLDLDQAAEWLADRPAGVPFGYVVTPNVDHVVRLHGRRVGAEAWQAYKAAALVLCDSRVLRKIARLRGVRLALAAGSDLTERLLTRIAAPGDRICLIGGDETTTDAVRKRRPDLALFQHIPPMGLMHKPAAMATAAAFATAAQARFTLLAVGSPQQELLARAIAEIPGTTGTGLCIGASIDFLTGRQRRAPRWMQRAGIEWLHRLLSEPRRMWRRYLVEGPRILLLAARWRPPR